MQINVVVVNAVYLLIVKQSYGCITIASREKIYSVLGVFVLCLSPMWNTFSSDVIIVNL